MYVVSRFLLGAGMFTTIWNAPVADAVAEEEVDVIAIVLPVTDVKLEVPAVGPAVRVLDCGVDVSVSVGGKDTLVVLKEPDNRDTKDELELDNMGAGELVL